MKHFLTIIISFSFFSTFAAAEQSGHAPNCSVLFEPMKLAATEFDVTSRDSLKANQTLLQKLIDFQLMPKLISIMRKFAPKVKNIPSEILYPEKGFFEITRLLTDYDPDSDILITSGGPLFGALHMYVIVGGMRFDGRAWGDLPLLPSYTDRIGRGLTFVLRGVPKEEIKAMKDALQSRPAIRDLSCWSSTLRFFYRYSNLRLENVSQNIPLLPSEYISIIMETGFYIGNKKLKLEAYNTSDLVFEDFMMNIFDYQWRLLKSVPLAAESVLNRLDPLGQISKTELKASRIFSKGPNEDSQTAWSPDGINNPPAGIDGIVYKLEKDPK